MAEEPESKALVPTKKIGKRGRPPKDKTKEGNADAPTKPKKWLLPVLKLDLTRDPAEQILQVPEIEQSRHLGWKVAEVRSINANLRLYESLPMVCQASGCYWASQCPTRPDFKFEGYLCPLEAMDIYRFFLGYVRDLAIEPSDYVDLRLVEDLVRIDIQLKRVDQQLSVKGMEVSTVGGVAQSRGEAIWEKTAHPLLIIQDKLRNRRSEIHKALMANRREKFERDRKEGKLKEDPLTFMDRILAAHLHRTKATVKETHDVIDVEAVSDDDETDNE